MLKQLSKLALFFLIGGLAFLTSCEKEELSPNEVEEYTEEVVFRMGEETNTGRHGCFELVFPVNVEFPDDTSEEVDSYEELRELISTWKENNPNANGRPHFELPFDVVLHNGNLVTIEDMEQVRRLRQHCKGKFDRPKGGKDRCFKLVFPVSIELPPTGDVEVANDPKEMKQIIRTWKSENPTSEERPSLVFPLDVIMVEDGTTVTVNIAEELQQLKEDCQG